MKGLDWSNERWVRIPIRDTAPWMLLGWPAQNLWLQLQRRMDRAGVIMVDPEVFPSESVCAMFPGAPPAEVETGLERLLSKGWLELSADKTMLFDPEFLERDEAAMSDKRRQRESRARRRDAARLSQIVTDGADPVTKRDEVSHLVTPGHTPSHRVTPNQPNQAIPGHTKPEARGGFDPKTADLPAALDAPGFRAKLIEYHAWRGNGKGGVLGKQWKPATWHRRLETMAEWGPERTIAAMEHSMNQEYQGLIEPKGGGAGTRRNVSTIDHAANRLRDERLEATRLL